VTSNAVSRLSERSRLSSSSSAYQPERLLEELRSLQVTSLHQRFSNCFFLIYWLDEINYVDNPSAQHTSYKSDEERSVSRHSRGQFVSAL